MLAWPFSIPALILRDDYDHYAEFPDFPYAEGVPGSLLIDSERNAIKQDWTANLQAFVVPGIDGADRFGGRLVIDSGTRFGLDTETDLWFHSPSKGGTATTNAGLGDANLVYRFAETQNIQMRSGVGVNWLADGNRSGAGVNFTYGIEWFPSKPWTISSIIDAGTIGHGSLFHNRTTVGVMFGATEAYVGYDYLHIPGSVVQGPVGGIGWRF